MGLKTKVKKNCPLEPDNTQKRKSRWWRNWGCLLDSDLLKLNVKVVLDLISLHGDFIDE